MAYSNSTVEATPSFLITMFAQGFPNIRAQKSQTQYPKGRKCAVEGNVELRGEVCDVVHDYSEE